MVGMPVRSPATRHELRLLAASRPGLPVLLIAGRIARPIRRVPGLGWVSSDPGTMRRILTDPEHFTIVGEGIVGDLWARILGNWVYDLFDGPGHHELRRRIRPLLTAERATALVDRAAGARLRQCTADLRAGRVVDVADLARVVVGRVMADMLGRDSGRRSADGTGDAPYRTIFATAERLAALAARSTGSRRIPPGAVAEARAAVARLTARVAAAWRDASDDTMLGGCRRAGLSPRETAGLAALLTVAGTQTSASALARTVALLHDTAEQHRLRAEPHRTADAVREGLRVSTPVPVITRSVTADVDVAGRRLRTGHRVLLLTHTAHNTAGGFALDRPDPGRPMWFGAGRHFCLGALIGRAELTALLDALLATGRPWQIIERRYGHRVLIPTYARLRITTS
jgi:cytochrome P450